MTNFLDDRMMGGTGQGYLINNAILKWCYLSKLANTVNLTEENVSPKKSS